MNEIEATQVNNEIKAMAVLLRGLQEDRLPVTVTYRLLEEKLASISKKVLPYPESLHYLSEVENTGVFYYANQEEDLEGMEIVEIVRYAMRNLSLTGQFRFFNALVEGTDDAEAFAYANEKIFYKGEANFYARFRRLIFSTRVDAAEDDSKESNRLAYDILYGALIRPVDSYFEVRTTLAHGFAILLEAVVHPEDVDRPSIYSNF